MCRFCTVSYKLCECVTLYRWRNGDLSFVLCALLLHSNSCWTRLRLQIIRSHRLFVPTLTQILKNRDPCVRPALLWHIWHQNCALPLHQHHDDQPELKLCDVFFWLSGSVCAVARSDEVCFFLCVSQSWRCLQESDAVKLYRFSLKEALEGAASCFWTDLPFFLKS